MPRVVNQLIGTVGRVGRAGESTVIDYRGTVRIYDGAWRSEDNVTVVLSPPAAAGDTALLAASIGRVLELAGSFEQDAPPNTTVRGTSALNILVG